MSPSIAVKAVCRVSRRRWYSAVCSATKRCGPMRASTAPTWAKLVGHCVLWETSAALASMSGLGPRIQPMRHPVMQ